MAGTKFVCNKMCRQVQQNVKHKGCRVIQMIRANILIIQMEDKSLRGIYKTGGLVGFFNKSTEKRSVTGWFVTLEMKKK